MVWVAHAHEYREGAPGHNQWHHCASHWKGVEVITYDDIPPHVEMVLLTPKVGYNVQGTVPLTQFDHPEEACYVFGADHKHLDLAMLPRTPNHLVYIPLTGYQEMYSWVACAITLYDREVKRG